MSAMCVHDECPRRGGRRQNDDVAEHRRHRHHHHHHRNGRDEPDDVRDAYHPSRTRRGHQDSQDIEAAMAPLQPSTLERVWGWTVDTGVSICCLVVSFTAFHLFVRFVHCAAAHVTRFAEQQERRAQLALQWPSSHGIDEIDDHVNAADPAVAQADDFTRDISPRAPSRTRSPAQSRSRSPSPRVDDRAQHPRGRSFTQESSAQPWRGAASRSRVGTRTVSPSPSRSPSPGPRFEPRNTSSSTSLSSVHREPLPRRGEGDAAAAAALVPYGVGDTRGGSSRRCSAPRSRAPSPPPSPPRDSEPRDNALEAPRERSQQQQHRRVPCGELPNFHQQPHGRFQQPQQHERGQPATLQRLHERLVQVPPGCIAYAKETHYFTFAPQHPCSHWHPGCAPSSMQQHHHQHGYHWADADGNENDAAYCSH